MRFTETQSIGFMLRRFVCTSIASLLLNSESIVAAPPPIEIVSSSLTFYSDVYLSDGGGYPVVNLSDGFKILGGPLTVQTTNSTLHLTSPYGGESLCTSGFEYMDQLTNGLLQLSAGFSATCSSVKGYEVVNGEFRYTGAYSEGSTQGSMSFYIRFRVQKPTVLQLSGLTGFASAKGARDAYVRFDEQVLDSLPGVELRGQFTNKFLLLPGQTCELSLFAILDCRTPSYYAPTYAVTSQGFSEVLCEAKFEDLRLDHRRDGSTPVLSWPNVGGLTLQVSDDLNTWVPASLQESTVGANREAILNTETQRKFYRLFRP